MKFHAATRFSLSAFFLIACFFTSQANAANGIALFGDFKYKPGFTHFDYVNPDAPKGGRMKQSASATFDSVNPYILKGIAAPGIASYLYQPLMVQSYDEPQSYYALIAESVTLSPDHRFADFTLNPAARWHDGKPITADDVVFSFNALKIQGHPSYRILYKPITIEKLSTRSVRFHFADPTQRELPILAASMPVLPQHYFCTLTTSENLKPMLSPSSSPLAGERKSASAAPRDSVGGPTSPSNQTSKQDAPPIPPTKSQSDLAPPPGGSEQSAACTPFDKTTLTPPLGSGPYRVKSIDPGRTVVFERVKDYWAANLPTQRGLYNFDELQYDVYRDDTVAIEGIKSHQFDYYEEFIARNWATAYDIPAVKSGALIKTRIPHAIPRGMQGFMFNTRRAKFADPRVREAIGLTLDFEWMNKTLFYGAYERNRSYFNNTDFEAKGLPSRGELVLLTPFRGPSEQPEKISAPLYLSSPLAGEPKSKERERRSDSVGGRTSPNNQPSKQGAPPIPPTKSQSDLAPPQGGSERKNAVPNAAANFLPESVFTAEYNVPRSDGSGYPRANLLRAQQLLNDAGWVMRNGRRVNAATGEPLTIEFLMTQRTFERVIAAMRQNLKKLGIAAEFRYVDAAQYQKRVDHRAFDIVSIWWNQGLFYPGSEQFTFWHSSQADIEGSQNLGGVKNPAVDALVERIRRAHSLAELTPAARALDRVLTHEHYVIPHWNINAWRVAYWDQFGRPEITPAYNIATESWWSSEVAASAFSSSPHRGEVGRGAPLAVSMQHKNPAEQAAPPPPALPLRGREPSRIGDAK